VVPARLGWTAIDESSLADPVMPVGSLRHLARTLARMDAELVGLAIRAEQLDEGTESVRGQRIARLIDAACLEAREWENELNRRERGL